MDLTAGSRLLLLLGLFVTPDLFFCFEGSSLNLPGAPTCEYNDEYLCKPSNMMQNYLSPALPT